MAFSWKRYLAALKSKVLSHDRSEPRRQRRPARVPRVELLEDRTLPSVLGGLSRGTLTVSLTAANDQAAVSLSGNNVLVTDGSGATVFTTPSSSVTGIDVEGSGAGGQSAALDSAGGTFTLPGGLVGNNVSGVTLSGDFTVGAATLTALSIDVTGGTTLSSRQVAAGGDPLTAPSTGNSGNLTLIAPTITVEDGASLLANATGHFTPGTVRLTADSGDTATWSGPDSNFQSESAQTSITVGAATIAGGNVNIQATATTSKKADLTVDATALSQAVEQSLAKLVGKATITFTPGASGQASTIARSIGDWLADGFKPGDTINVQGSRANDGTYSIASATSTTLTLAAVNRLTSETFDQSANLLNLKQTFAKIAGSPFLTFKAGNGQSATILRGVGDWIQDGFAPGQTVSVTGSRINDGTYTILSLTDSTLTLALDAVLHDETDVAGSATVLAQLDDQVEAKDVPLAQADANGNPVPNTTASAADVTKALNFLTPVTNLIGIPFNAEGVQSQTQAQIHLNSGAVVTASGSVDVKSSATSDVDLKTPALVLGAAYGDSEGTARTVIAGNVTITAGGDVTIESDVDNTMKVETDATSGLVSSGAHFPIQVPGPALTVAYGHGVSSSDAEVDSGATIGGKNVSVTAGNTNEFEVKATSDILMPGTNQGFAAGVAVNEVSSTSTAVLGGTVNAGGNVTVNGHTTNTLNRAGSIASVSQEPPGGALSSKLSSDVQQFNLDSRSNPGQLGVSAALTIVSSTNTANAQVLSRAQVNAGGGLSVVAQATDNFQAAAEGEAESDAKYSLGGAVAYTNYANSANASIARLAQVNAKGALTVEADATVPLQAQVTNDLQAILNFGFDLPSFDTSGAMPFFKSAYDFAKTFGEQSLSVFDHIKPYLTSQAGAPDAIATTFVAAGASSGNEESGSPGQFSLSGSVNLLTVHNTAKAWIDGGAQVNTNPAYATPGQSVSVNGNASISTVNVGGIPSLASLATGATKSSGSELGGTYNGVTYDNTAEAWIAGGATVDARGDITVDTRTTNLLVTVNESGGKAGQYGIEGTFVLQDVHNTSLAWIDGTANVAAGGNLSVSADNSVIGVAVSASVVMQSGDLGVGVSVGVNQLDNTTEAYIGSTDPNAVTKQAGTDSAGGTVNVKANSNELFVGIAIAGTVAGNSGGEGGGSGGGGSDPLDGVSLPTLFQEDPTGGESKTAGIAISGDAGVNLMTDHTEAWIDDGATVSGTRGVNVTANDTSLLVAVSGGLALSFGESEGSLGIAGSFTYNDLNRTVLAYVTNATIKSPAAVALNATTGDKLLTVTAGAAAAPNGTAAITGSANLNQYSGDTEAGFGTGANVSAGGAVTASAADTLKVLSIAGAFALGNQNAIGAGGDVGIIGDTVKAYVGPHATVNAGGPVEITAAATEEMLSIAASLTASPDGNALTGSASAYTINPDVEASIGAGAVVLTPESVLVSAQNTDDLIGVGGAGTFGSDLGIGAALAYDNSSPKVLAYIDAGATVYAGGGDTVGDGTVSGNGVVLDANATETFWLIGAAGAIAASGIAGSGSAVVNIVNSNVQAYVGSGAKVNVPAANDPPTTQAQSVLIRANENTKVTAVAGAAAGAEDAGIGVAVDSENVTRNVTANVAASAVVDAAANVVVQALAPETMLDVAAGLALSGGVSGVGSAVVLILSSTVEAFLDDDSTVKAGGSVQVSADRQAHLTPIAGGLAVGPYAGIGVSTATTVTRDHTLAYVGKGASVTASGHGTVTVPTGQLDGSGNETTGGVAGLAVTATSVENLLPVSASGALLGAISVAGSATVTDLNETTQAYAEHGALLNPSLTGAFPAQVIDFVAADGSTSQGGTGGVAVTGGGGIGAALDMALVTKDTEAYLGVGVTAQAQRAVEIQALNRENVLSVAVSVGVGTGSVGLAGAGSVYKLHDTTTAYVGGNAQVFTPGSVLVAAADQDQIDEVAGALSSGNLGVSGSLGLTILDKATTAYVAAGAGVVAEGNGTALTADTGQFSVAYGARPSGNALTNALNQLASKLTQTAGVTDLTKQRAATPVTTSFNGLAVTAISQDDVETTSAGAGQGGGVGVQAVASLSLPENVTTQAYIDGGAAINTTAAQGAAGQSVLVAAGADYYHLGLAGGAGFAPGLDLAPSVEMTDGGLTTTAYVGAAATVNAAGNVLVTANAEENFVSLALGLSLGGFGAITASASAAALTDHTNAYIAGQAVVKAGGNVLVAANDTTGTLDLIGSAALSLGGGADASVGVTVLNKNTVAYVGQGATVNATGNSTASLAPFGSHASPTSGTSVQGLDVEANSGETDSTVAVGGAAAGVVALAGSVSVEVIDTNTTAYIDGGAFINQAGSTAAAQSVYVIATDAETIEATDGTVAAALVGGAMAGGVDVGILNANTRAYLAPGAHVRAAADVNVLATTSRNITSNAVAGGVSTLLSLAAGVSVYSLDGLLDGDSQSATNSGSQHNPKDGKPANSGTAQTATGFADGQTGGGAVTGGLANYGNQYKSDSSPAGQDIESVSTSADDSVNNGIKANAVDPTANGSVPAPPAGTTASIGSGVTIAAGGTINDDATDTVTLNTTVGSASVGLIGVGGAVAVVNVADPTTAQVQDGAILRAGTGGSSRVNVQANYTSNLTANAYAGEGGVISLGAQVVEVNDSGTTTAALGLGNASPGAQVDQAGSIALGSTANRTLSANATGGQFGAVVAGVAISTAKVTGTTSASVGNGAQIGTAAGKTVGSMTVVSTDYDSASATSTGVQAGLIAAGVNQATARVKPTVQAVIGNQVTADLQGGLGLSASMSGTAAPTTNGVIVGLIDMGVSQATGDLSPNVSASVGSGTNVTAGGGVIVNAGMGTANCTPTGTASGGGALSGNGVSTTATFNPQITSTIGQGARVQAGGSLGVGTSLYYAGLNVLANSEGNNYGGIAVGDSVASTTAHPLLRTEVDPQAVLTAGADLNVAAETTDKLGSNNVGTIGARAGGSVGAAIGIKGTSATVDDEPSVSVGIDSGSALSARGSVTVAAQSNVGGSPSASAELNGLLVVGLTSVNVTLDNTALVLLQSGAGLTASTGNVTVAAQTYDNVTPSATGGTGGAFANALGTSTTINLQDNTEVTLAGGNNVQANAGTVTIEALSGGSLTPSSSDTTNGAGISEDDSSTTVQASGATDAAGQPVPADLTAVSIGGNSTQIFGNVVSVLAGAQNYSVTATSTTNSTTAINKSDATTTVTPDFQGNITLASGASLTGLSSLTLSAYQPNDTSSATATAENNGGLAKVDAVVNHTFVGKTDVEVAGGAQLTTTNLTVTSDTPDGPGQYTSTANFKVSVVQQILNEAINLAVEIFTFGLVQNTSIDHVYIENTDTRSGKINFNGTAHLLTGSDPFLWIDKNGNVVANRGVAYTKSGNTFIVSPLTNTVFPSITFNGPDGGLLEGLPNFFIGAAWQNVTILNLSPDNLVLDGINVANLTTQLANINVNMAAGAFTAPLVKVAIPDCTVDVENTGGGNLSLAGPVVNPEGTTTLDSAGSIVSSGTGAVVTTTALQLTSYKGGVGTATSPIHATLVSNPLDGKVPATSLSGSAARDFDAAVNQQGYYSGPPNPPATFPAAAIDNVSSSGGSVSLTLGGGQTEDVVIGPPGYWPTPTNLFEKEAVGDFLPNDPLNPIPGPSNFPAAPMFFSPLALQAEYAVSGVQAHGSVTIADSAADLSVGSVTATTTATLSAAGSITGADKPATPDVTAPTVSLSAGAGAGTSGHPLQTQAATLGGSAGTGGFFVHNAGALTVNGVKSGGPVSLTGDNNLTVTGPITAASYVVMGVPGGKTMSLQAGVQGQSVSLVGDAASTIVLGSVPAGSPTTINFVGGGSTVQIAAPKTIQGGLTIYGSGTDTLLVNDGGNRSAEKGALSATTLTGLGMGAAGITYSGLGALDVMLGHAGGNSFTVTGVAPSTQTTIDGGLADNATLSANVAGDLAGWLDLLDFPSATMAVGGNLAGTILDPATIASLAVGGAVQPGAVIQAGAVTTMTVGPNALTVGDNMAGKLQVQNNLGLLRVAGGTPGSISARRVGLIEAYGGYGPVVLDVTENGIERRLVEATAADPNPQPDPNAVATKDNAGYVNVQYVYESGTPANPGSLANPQLTARISNGAGTNADQYDLSLETFNDKAKFNLARLEDAAVAAVGNVTVEGDVLTSVSAQANAFFTVTVLKLPPVVDTTAAGVRLPQDHLAGVEVRDALPAGEVQARSIQALAFGSTAPASGPATTGASTKSTAAAALLAPGTKIALADDTFRVPFADQAADQVGLFLGAAAPGTAGSFSKFNVAFTVESVLTPNAQGTANVVTPSNTARGADVALVTTTAGPNHSGVIQTIGIIGDGASITTQQPITRGISSTGPLGDLNLLSTQGVPNVFAPSIFGSIVTNGAITGIVQTTGIRMDPITGVSTVVPADLGNVYVTGSGKSAHLTTTTVTAPGGISGELISRGNLLSQVVTGGISGVVAAQGNVGSVSGSTELGGIVANGDVSGSVVALGQLLADLVVTSNLLGRVAIEGGIPANVTVDGAIDPAAALVSGGGIGSAVTGARLEAGSVAGIVGAVGAINPAASASTSQAAFFGGNLGNTLSGQAIDLVFMGPVQGGLIGGEVPLRFDVNPLDLAGLAEVVANLNGLHVTKNGNLAN